MSLARDRVLGVIDLRDGCAVHAVAGRRGQYRPHDETARSSPDPLVLAEIYRRAGVGGLYVADLDALSGGDWQADRLGQLAAGDLPIWIDAGVRSLQDWRQKRARLDAANVHWILATETFEECDDEREAADFLRSDRDQAARLTVGIDLCDGQVRLPGGARQAGDAAGPAATAAERLAPLAIVDRWVSRGIRSFLPLELRAVGVSGGPATASLCRQIRQRHPPVQLLSGGGVRDEADLQRLLDAGCDRVLVATALLNGKIPPDGSRGRGNKS